MILGIELLQTRLVSKDGVQEEFLQALSKRTAKFVDCDNWEIVGAAVIRDIFGITMLDDQIRFLRWAIVSPIEVMGTQRKQSQENPLPGSAQFCKSFSVRKNSSFDQDMAL